MISIVVCIDMDLGMGLHAWTIPPANLTGILKCQYVFGIAYSMSTATIKMSLLFQYLRIFERHTWFNLITKIVLAIVGVWGFAFTFMSIFNCFPSPAAFWDGTRTGCYGFASPDNDELLRMIVGHAGTNLGLDLLVLAIAIRLQFEEGVATNRRSMLLLLSVGTVSCSFALWRFILVNVDGPVSTQDPTFHQPPTFLLSIVEIYLAASCATTPIFWPIVRESITKIFVTYELNITSEVRCDILKNRGDIEGVNIGKKFADFWCKFVDVGQDIVEDCFNVADNVTFLNNNSFASRDELCITCQSNVASLDI